MKKIVSVLALSALVAGSVFAEASVAGQLRVGTNLFSVKKTGATYSDVKKNTESTESKTTYAFNDMAKGIWGDNLIFKFSGEKAGVEVYTKIDLNDIYMDYAFAWMQFGDSFKLYAGTKDTRGSLKLVNPLDGSWWNNYCGYGKPGVYQAGLDFGKESANVTTVNGSKAVNLMGEYAINDSMKVRLALFRGTSNYDITEASRHSDGKSDDKNIKANDTESLFAGFSGAAQFDMKQDKFILTFTAKVKGGTTGKGKDNATSFGLFVNPIVVNGLDLLVGYTFANKDSFNDVGANSAHAIDVRAAYKTGAITVSTLNNITIKTDESGKNKNDDGIYSWHTVGFAYKVNDILSAVGVQAKLESGKNAWGREDKDGNCLNNTANLNVRPYVDLTAMKGAVLSVGVDVGVSNLLGGDKADATITVDIPVCFRVRL